MTGLQKRHFERAAKIVFEAPPSTRTAIMRAFIRLFSEAPRFDRGRFERACGGDALPQCFAPVVRGYTRER